MPLKVDDAPNAESPPSFSDFFDPIRIADFRALADREPAHALVENTDLVLIRHGEQVSVLYGRCLHRGALLADGRVEGDNLVCGLHDWDYRFETGVSAYNHEEALPKFDAVVREGGVWIDRAAVVAFEEVQPQPFDREAYLGAYADKHPEAPEPHTAYIQALARDGLGKVGHHGPLAAMGVPRDRLPSWDAIQLLPAQLARRPLMDGDAVDTRTVIGPGARKPLVLAMPLFVSDMSFGALSREAKLALAKGAEMAGTGICSGEGGMLEEEQAANGRYLYELASARFGFAWEKLQKVQAFHFKGGQGAKTGTGGHLPGHKVNGEIARVRGLAPGTAAISPAAFPDLVVPADFRAVAERVRRETGGIPVGFKLAASRIEADIDFALEVGVDYLILDGRGGGTGAAPTILRDHINVPTLPALARARRHLDRVGASGVSLVITGGLRVPADFVKALAMGADAVALSNSALQAIGCLGMRACHTDRCPVGIATQQEHLRARQDIDRSARQLANFLEASRALMQVLARACGHDALSGFRMEDLSTFDREIHHLTGIAYAGVHP